jgi:TnpA family transposase
VVERLEFIRHLNLDSGCLKRVHQNRLLQFTRTGAKSTPAHLSRLDELRRYAILVAFLIEWSASLVDYAIGMHDKMMGKLFNKSEHQHGDKFQRDGKAINEKVRLYAQVGKALIAARDESNDAYQAIESVLDWEKFVSTVAEAEKLARPADFDYLELLDNRYSQLRRYTPKLLETFEFKATSASLPVIKALEVIKELNISGGRKVPESADTSFVKPRWLKHVIKGDTIDRHYYEMCALAELRSGLRSGDIWVAGSKQFQDFEDYLLPDSSWQSMRSSNTIPVAVTTDFTNYIEQRSLELSEQLALVSSVIFYTHISDQYAPFHVKVINATIRDATHVLDGLLYHESDLQIQEHYTDTSGYTEHVFAMCHLLGFRFAPRMRDLPDKKLYTFEPSSPDSVLAPLLGDKINVKLIQESWDEILRLASSIRTGTVTASLMLRKLASYPRQNRLALALRELGRIERTLFTLEWLQSPELRRRATAGLNKGEAKHTLKRAVFFNRLGEIRDRSYEDQFYRASGLNLVIAAIVLWNTVYLEKAVDYLKQEGMDIPEEYLQHLSPLGWEHINLTGDYVWNLKQATSFDQLRPLRVKENKYR